MQGGGPVRLTNLLVWGVDLVEEHLLCRCAQMTDVVTLQLGSDV